MSLFFAVSPFSDLCKRFIAHNLFFVFLSDDDRGAPWKNNARDLHLVEVMWRFATHARKKNNEDWQMNEMIPSHLC